MKPQIAKTVTQSGDGQILVLAAFLMVILIGITGLAIDASAAYVADRWQRSVADAAALAGGQDLQVPGSVAAPDPTGPEYPRARLHAMQVLVSELGSNGDPVALAATPACLAPGGCQLPGTPYIVAVRVPTPSWVDCTPARCVQVSVRQPSFGLTFGRIFGQNNWSVNTASVAGVVQAHQYGVVTLRAPKPRSNGTDANEDDIKITGGSIVHVGLADVSTNTNMIYSGTNSLLDLNIDYRVNFYDINQAWSGAPPGNRVSSLVPDPQYPIPQRIPGTTPEFATQAAGQDTDANCHDAVTGEQMKVPLEYKRRDGTSVRNMPANKVICLKPGVYLRPIVNSDHDAAIILEPGVYFLDAGMDNSSTIIGGYEGGQPGVALVFLEARNQNGSAPGQLTANSSDLLSLNMGSQYLNPAGTRAIRADGPQGPVQTTGPQPILITLIVVPDQSCLPIVSPPPSACNESLNKTLNLPGGGELFVVGVQYAPTDNVFVRGNSTSTGTLGQVISWTIEFNSSFLNLEAAVTDATGVLRLDLACSPTVNICNP